MRRARQAKDAVLATSGLEVLVGTWVADRLRAKELGFLAMQFNFVVSTNVRAIKLWRSLGFETVGRLPNGFRHPKEGLVDALVMYRSL